MIRKHTAGALLTLMVALTACQQINQQDPQSSALSEFDYAVTLTVSAHEHPEEVAQRLGGQVLHFYPQERKVTLGISRLGAEKLQRSPAVIGSMSTADPFVLESNRDVFIGGGVLARMGGRVTAWSGGRVTAWSGGRVTAWSGGTYLPVPENSSIWQQVRLQQAQSLASNLGTGVKVAVIDTGIDVHHPAFEGSLAPQSDWWDFVDNDSLPQEEGRLGEGGYGHGTEVAGIVLQVAPHVQILPLRVLDSDGAGDVLSVAAAINHAVAKGASVINLSLGSDVRSSAVALAIKAATDQDILVFSSSGNTGDQRVTFPAIDAYDENTTVGYRSVSVGSVDALGNKSSFSTYGTAAHPVELVAPGENVYGPGPEGTLVAWSGTSMAAPMAAGAAALALGERLSVPQGRLAHEATQRVSDIYNNNQNKEYQNMIGKGQLNLEEFIKNVTER